MDIITLLVWITAVTAITVLGSWYAARYGKPDLLIGLYVVFIAAAQILATKVAVFDLGFATFTGPAGVIVFAVTFLITDIVNEKFGRTETMRMIMIAFISQLALALFLWLGTRFPAEGFWASMHDENAWNALFGLVPQIMFASWVAFLVSENVDAYIYAWFKKLTGGAHLWLRNVLSSIPALALDSLIFVPIAFWGILDFPFMAVIAGQIAVKWAVGVISVPFMYINRAVLTRGEHSR